MSAKLTAIWIRLPAFVRSFVIDAAEGAIAAVLLLNLALPHTTTEATAQALIVLGAIASPIIAAARRRLVPGIASWLVRTFPRPA